MLVNKLYLLLIVIVVILLCKNTIEGLKGYKYDGLNYSHCASIPGSILCELSHEDCIKGDFSGFKNDGEHCSVDGYSGTCITIQVDEGGKKLCNVTNDEINRIYQSELNSNPPIDTYSGNNYYTIKKVNTSPDSPQQSTTSTPQQPTTLYAYTHAPACSEDSSIASRCASLMEGEYVNCSNNPDCCLCNQSNWNKVYTSKNSDTPGNKLAQKSFNNIPLFNNVPSGDKEGYNIVKLDDTNKGNFTDRLSNDNFKRYFELPVGVSDKYYTPSKGYFFNQYNDNYETLHEFNLNEYPGYIESGSGSIMNEFFYEECLYEKDDHDQCVCNNTSEPSASGINPRNPNCIPCPSGEHIQAPGGKCVACSESNKVLDTRDGTCVTCDSLDYCNGRYKCIYAENEQGEGECHQIDLHENQQVIRSDCVPKNTVDAAAAADACGLVSGAYHLSSDTSTLDEFYSACSSNCEVVQSIIDSTEGYINYNSESVTTPVATSGVINNDYNLITNEYCKSIDDANKCDQIKHCEWKTDKCLLDIHGTTETNQLSDNLYYIPLPNVFNNSLELNDCSTGTECSNVDRCSISTPLPIEYESSLDGGIVNNELFDRNIKCKNLSSDRNHINDIKYDGDPKGFCFNDGTTNTMTPVGCLDSTELNDLILHKSGDYITTVVTKAYLTDLINMRESVAEVSAPAEPAPAEPSTPPEIQSIGITTNHNLITDPLLEGDCISDPSDSSNCDIDLTKSSKLIDTCRELCENNTEICNEYGVKFPTSVDDYSNAGCYLSKYCTEGGNSDCIQQPCTAIGEPYSGCIPQNCTGIDLPYQGCKPTYTQHSDGNLCNAQITSTLSTATEEGCRNHCDGTTECLAYYLETHSGGRYGGETYTCHIWNNNQGISGPQYVDCEPTEVCTSPGYPCYEKNIFCNTSLTDPREGCIPPPCTGVDQPYVGCLEQPCTGVDQPYVGCIPNYIAFPDNHYCNMIRPFGGVNTDEGDDITDNSCRIRCSQLDNCTGYQFNSATATRDQQCLIYGGATFGDVDTPSLGSYCYKKDI